jgi:hypothetical protein
MLTLASGNIFPFWENGADRYVQSCQSPSRTFSIQIDGNAKRESIRTNHPRKVRGGVDFKFINPGKPSIELILSKKR